MNLTVATASRQALRAGERRATGRRLTRPLLPLLAHPSSRSTATTGPRMSTAAAAGKAPVDAPFSDPLTANPPCTTEHGEGADSEGQDYARMILRRAVAADASRQDWTRKEIAAIYYQPPLELAYQAVRPHSCPDYVPGSFSQG